MARAETQFCHLSYLTPRSGEH